MYKNPEDQRHSQRERRRRIRDAWFRENGPCVRCGSKDDLQLDHADPALKVHHNVWTWSTQRRAEELAKCQALCLICHKAKTSGENSARFRRTDTCRKGHCYAEVGVYVDQRTGWKKCAECARIARRKRSIRRTTC
ncbi:HNH endonuclease [Streptomyces sp. NPDC005551]|uniref:HNH endonuclease n=1 Tax=Streptomyces sp. NPDC005551 TaxID=3364725 RepID=UPI003677377B